MDLRERVARLIRERAVSLRALSQASGVRRQSIMSFLRGANLHLNNLNKILSALGCELNIVPSSPVRAQAPLKNRLPTDRRALAKFCRRHGITRLAVFGSVLRHDFRKGSDIDVVIDFEKPVSFFELATLEEGLRGLMPTSHRLDIVTSGSLSRHIREEVLKECEVLYEKAA